MRDVIVVGGGISGATLLHRLAKLGVDVHLLEGGERLGGVIGSYRDSNGLLMESGPNTVAVNNELFDLIRELDLDNDVMRPSESASSRYIVRDGDLRAAPMGPLSLLRTPLFSRRAKLRLLREPWIPRLSDQIEESVAAFVERRFGREFLDYAIDPLVGGVFAGRAERLSLRFAFPSMHRMEQECGSIMRAAMRKALAMRKGRRRGQTPPPKGLISFSQGMGMLPARIGERWDSRVTYGFRVERIGHSGDGWFVEGSGERCHARILVIAAEASGAADLVEPLDPGAATALRAIEYPPVTVAVSHYAREAVKHPLNGFGMLIPSSERAGILGTLFSSSLFPGRAPDGTVLLTTFIGGSRGPEAARSARHDLEDIVHSDLRNFLGISAGPLAFQLQRWERAIPQYLLGYGGILDAITKAERAHPGLFLTGSYRGGVSVGDCVRTGSMLAQHIAQRLTPSTTLNEDHGAHEGEGRLNHQEL